MFLARDSRQIVIYVGLAILAFLATTILGKLILGLIGVHSYFGGFMLGAGIITLIYSTYISTFGRSSGAFVVAVDSEHSSAHSDDQEEEIEDKVQEIRQELEEVDVSDLPQSEFEELVAVLLGHQGLEVSKDEELARSGFQLLARRKNKSFAIRIEHSQHLLSHDMVEAIIAAKTLTDCDGLVIITDGLFSEEAQQLSDGLKCKLADKDVLERWVAAFQQSNFQRAA